MSEIVPTPAQPVAIGVPAIAIVNPAAAIKPAAPIVGMPNVFAELGFTAVAGGNRSLFISIEGATGTGKTRFLKTCPPPIGVIDFDKGMKGVTEVDQFGNPILRRTLELPDFDDKGPADKRGVSAAAVSPTQMGVARNTYEQFKYVMHKLLSELQGGTVCVDNCGAIYTCAMAARFGQLARVGDVPGQMWRMMKAEFEQIFTDAYDHNVNLVVTQRQKGKFDMKGEFEVDGFLAMMSAAQVHLVFDKRMVAPPVPPPMIPGQYAQPIVIQPPEVELSARVLKCRQRIGLEGHEFKVVWLDNEKTESIGLDFVTVAKAVYPMTVDGDWIRP